jgi:hypothetical protein
MLEQMIKNVANYFLEEMKDNDFETFDEMKECYWWTSKDIKDAVDSLLGEHNWYIDEIDGSDIFDNNGNVVSSYRPFMTKVYKIIK